MTEHYCVLGARYAIEQLVWLKRMTAESADRIERRTAGNRSFTCTTPHPAGRQSQRVTVPESSAFPGRLQLAGNDYLMPATESNSRGR